MKKVNNLRICVHRSHLDDSKLMNEINTYRTKELIVFNDEKELERQIVIGDEFFILIAKQFNHSFKNFINEFKNMPCFGIHYRPHGVASILSNKQNKLFFYVANMNLTERIDFNDGFLFAGISIVNMALLTEASIVPVEVEEAVILFNQGKQKVLFLDRDGILNKDSKYLIEFKDVSWVDGVIDLIKTANQLQYRVIIMTNQSGIARGYFQYSEVLRLHYYMDQYLKSKSANIDAFYMSPYHDDAKAIESKKNKFSRKPMPGMLLEALVDWDIDIANSLMIGDKISDQLLGVNLKTYFLQGEYNLNQCPPDMVYSQLKDIQKLL